jgi:hypothetical protein
VTTATGAGAEIWGNLDMEGINGLAEGSGWGRLAENRGKDQEENTREENTEEEIIAGS